MNHRPSQEVLRPERKYPFGDSRHAEIMRSQKWYEKLSLKDRARAEGWLCGCPVVETLIESRGPEAMLVRYTEVNDMWARMMHALDNVNPALGDDFAAVKERQREELPGMFDNESIPGDHVEHMAPIGTLYGYAIPRVLIELSNKTNGSVFENRAVLETLAGATSPYELAAELSIVAEENGVEPTTIFRHTLCKGWVDEHGSTDSIAEMALAYAVFAPELWKTYASMSDAERQEFSVYNDFSTTIENRSANQEQVTSPEFFVAHNGKAHVKVRERGGFIVEGKLEGPGGKPTDVLFSETDHTRAKLSATHFMYPVGPSEGVGGQHGPDRWADHKWFVNSPDRVSMQAKRGDVAGTSMLREVALVKPNTLEITNTLLSNSHTPEATSMGEHLYLLCAEEEIRGIRVNGKSIEEFMGADTLEALLAHGHTYELSEMPEVLELEFPDGRTLRIFVFAEVNGSEQEPGLWVWHRAGTNSICFEPIVGVKGDDNDGLTLMPYKAVQLKTRVELADA